MSVKFSYKNIFRRLFFTPSPPLPLSPSLHPSIPLSLSHSFSNSLFLSITLSFLLSSSIYSQPTNCLQRLADAENLFQKGIFEDIPDILEECLDSYESSEKLKALKLIVLSRYMNDDVTGSEETMQLLLKEFPLFTPDASDPVDFQFVYNEFQVKRLVDIGIFLGTETAWGIITEPWSPFADEYNYAPGFPGYSAGVELNFHINSNFVINTQPALSSYKFRIHYDDPINEVLYLKQNEQQSLIELPLYFQAEFLKASVKPYAKLGGSIGILISSSTTSSIERYDPTYNEIIYSSGDIKNNYKEFRTSPILFIGGGIGLNVDFNKYGFFIELNYHQSVNEMMKKGSDRYTQQSLWTEGWFDSDFRLNKASLRVGFVKSFYWIKKRKQE